MNVSGDHDRKARSGPVTIKPNVGKQEYTEAAESMKRELADRNKKEREQGKTKKQLTNYEQHITNLETYGHVGETGYTGFVSFDQANSPNGLMLLRDHPRQHGADDSSVPGYTSVENLVSIAPRGSGLGNQFMEAAVNHSQAQGFGGRLALYNATGDLTRPDGGSPIYARMGFVASPDDPRSMTLNPVDRPDLWQQHSDGRWQFRGVAAQAGGAQDSTTEPPLGPSPGESWDRALGMVLPFLFVNGAKGDPLQRPEGYDSAAKASTASYETQSRFFQSGDPIDGNPFHRRYSFPNNGGHVDVQAYAAQGDGQGFTSQFFDADNNPVGGGYAVQNFWGQKSGLGTSWSAWRTGKADALTRGRITTVDGEPADLAGAGLANAGEALLDVKKVRDRSDYSDWKQWASSGTWEGLNGLISWGKYLSAEQMAVKFKDGSFAVGIDGNRIKGVLGDDWVGATGLGGTDWSGYSGQLLVDKSGQPALLQLSNSPWANWKAGYTFVYQYDPAHPGQKKWVYQKTDDEFLTTYKATTLSQAHSGIRFQIPAMNV